MRTKILIALLLITFRVAGQIINPKETAKRKAEDRTNRGIDRTLDKGMDKVEEGIGNIFKKKDKKNKKEEAQTAPQTGTPQYDPTVTTTDKQGNTDYSAYKEFDFVPGEDILFFEDFADRSKNRWGAYDTHQLNILNHDGKNWLEVKSGSFYPLGLKILPKNFTLEFDVYTPDENAGSLDIRFLDKSQASALNDPWLDNCSMIDLSPVTQMPKTGLGSYKKKINNDEVNPQNEFRFFSWQPESGNHYARISLVAENNKMSLWVNKEKVMENTDFFVTNREHLLAFHLQNYFVAENRMYLTNFRLATGTANPKKEIVTEKKFVTHNIYFDVNSDVIRPNSYAVLKQIAESIQEIEGQILIVGHTDSDGNDNANLILSQKRAASVKRALVNEFGIDSNRLSADGKGESVPLNKNASPAEKAENRRVEFVKL